MDQLFGNLKGFFKTKTVTIDNVVFRMHYKLTVVILIAFSIVVTGRQYIGDPIDCISGDFFGEASLLDTYCWLHTTFSVVSAWKTEVGPNGVAYPGVDKATKDDEKVYHAYYQWVCFMLFFQAILFYVPRYFWKSVEAHRIKNLMLGLDSPIVDKTARASNQTLLVEYLHLNRGNHSVYLYSYVAAEVLNFVNVIGQMFLMDSFLGGEFTKYGTEVISFTEWEPSVRFDPMLKVFPRITKCSFYKYGSSGSVQIHDAMCILPINILNEKIYVFLWFWFVFLAFVTGLALAYRAAIILLPRLRFEMTSFRARIVPREKLQEVFNKCQLGDWLVLDFLAKNLDSLNYRDLITELANKWEKSS